MRRISNSSPSTSRASSSRNDEPDTSPTRARPGARQEAPEGLPQRRAAGANIPSPRTILSRTYNTTAVGLMATGAFQAVTNRARGDGTAAAQGVQMAGVGFQMLAGRAIVQLSAGLLQEGIAAVRRMLAPQIDRGLLLGALNHVTVAAEGDPDDMTDATGVHTQQVVDHLADLADGVAAPSVVDAASRARDSRALVNILLGLVRGDHGEPVRSRRATSSSTGH